MTGEEPQMIQERTTLIRAAIGGVLMGLANLVPGISGGTMLLASGVYTQFIRAVAEISTLRFRAGSMLTLGVIIFAAILAIALLAGTVSGLVVSHRWVMYSLFIGLTLGGAPLLWRMVRPVSSSAVVMCIVGVALMGVMAVVRPGAAATDDGARAYIMYGLAGLAGASAMVLPGVSGGYLLLVLGQYVAILGAIDAFKDGLVHRDMSAIGESMGVILPVGIGVILGIVGVSNLLKLALDRCEKATLGLLLGLLLGSVLGLWPFQKGVPPEVGSIFQNDTVVLVDGGLVMEAAGVPIKEADYATAFFAPGVGQVLGAIALLAAGFAAATLISHLGGKNRTGNPTNPGEACR